jgi:hypothetical protein
MQNHIERKFYTKIRKRSSGAYSLSRAKICFTSLFIIGCLLGYAAFSTNTAPFSSTYITFVERHISAISSASNNLAQSFIDVINLSKTDICHLFFVFIAGFTYFCFPVTGAIVFAKGFMLSFSLMFLSRAPSVIALFDTTALFINFCFIKLFIGIITVMLASETYVFSYDFRAIKQNFSILRRSSVTYKFIFIFIKSLGGCLLLNFIYYSIIKLL